MVPLYPENDPTPLESRHLGSVVPPDVAQFVCSYWSPLHILFFLLRGYHLVVSSPIIRAISSVDARVYIAVVAISAWPSRSCTAVIVALAGDLGDTPQGRATLLQTYGARREDSRAPRVWRPDRPWPRSRECRARSVAPVAPKRGARPASVPSLERDTPRYAPSAATVQPSGGDSADTLGQGLEHRQSAALRGASDPCRAG